VIALPGRLPSWPDRWITPERREKGALDRFLFTIQTLSPSAWVCSPRFPG
jgi:hypothetical protein